MSEFFITYIGKDTILPDKKFFSAVFLIALEGTKILAIKNDRGWDIPGGHIENGETPEEALAREVQEEAGVTFSDAKLFAIIQSNNQDIYKDKIMLIYITNNFTCGTFTPAPDAFGREVIEVKDFLQRYSGKANFTELISRAQNCFLNN